jgi:hypothetical protein
MMGLVLFGKTMASWLIGAWCNHPQRDRILLIGSNSTAARVTARGPRA